ncbi:MAG: hypothetical protein KDH88_15280 [Chromatiales bacterium]|nr:hypothetical protein [Chromatiales bacterium]
MRRRAVLLLSIFLAEAALAEDSWVLRGTVVGDGDRRFAILQAPRGGEQQNYREGSVLPDGLELVEVLPYGVRVDDGQGESLLRFGARLKPARKLVLPPPPRNVSVQRQEILSAAKDLPGLLSDVEIRPKRSGGAVRGYSVARARPGGLAYRLGFRKGDVITHLNGQALSGKTDAWQLFEKLKGEQSISVSLERDGSPLSVDFQLH